MHACMHACMHAYIHTYTLFIHGFLTIVLMDYRSLLVPSRRIYETKSTNCNDVLRTKQQHWSNSVMLMQTITHFFLEIAQFSVLL